MKSVEGLIGEINKAGWLITELYQRDHDQWFATLRQRGDFSAANGEGAIVAEALASAWEQARQHKRMSNADWGELKNQSLARPAKITRPGKVERPRISSVGTVPIERPRRISR